MDFAEYQQKALRTAPKGNVRDMTLYHVVGVVGEAGEVARTIETKRVGKIKKADFRAHLVKESGDTIWYAANFMTVHNYNLPPCFIQGRFFSAMSQSFERRRAVARPSTKLALSALELLEIHKKMYFSGHPLNANILAMHIELILGVLDGILVANNVTWSEVMEENIAKLWLRFPDGFNADDSMNRKA